MATTRTAIVNKNNLYSPIDYIAGGENNQEGQQQQQKIQP